MLTHVGKIKPHTSTNAEVYILSKMKVEDIHLSSNGYRPQFYFRTTDVTGAATLPSGTEMVMPGDNVTMTVTVGWHLLLWSRA